MSKPPSVRSNTAIHLDYIDALRGAACLWVVGFHANMMWPHQFLTGDLFLSHLWTGFLSAGTLGVNVFLVLSGFCLFWPLARKNDLTLPLREFFQRRAWRILPSYYVVLLLTFALTQWSETARFLERPTHRFDLLSHLLMLHNLRPTTFFTIFPPAWSLALEFQLYLIFPLLVWLVRRGGLRLMLVVAGGITAAWLTFFSQRYGMGLPAGWTYWLWVTVYYSLPARLFEFALGMAGAALVARPNRFPAAGVGVLGMIGLALYYGLGRWVPGSTAWQNPAFGLFTAASLVLLGYRAVGGSREPGRALPFVFRPLVAVGVFSYSLYLTHYQIIQLAQGYLTPRFSPMSQKIVFLLAVLPALLLLGRVSFALIEKPFMGRGKIKKAEPLKAA